MKKKVLVVLLYTCMISLESIQASGGSKELSATALALKPSELTATQTVAQPEAPEILLPDMTVIDANELKRIRELQAYDERKINDPANDQLLTDENFKKQFSSDPRYKEFNSNNLNFSHLSSENLVKGPSGYTPLLHIVHAGDDELLREFIETMLFKIFSDPHALLKETQDMRAALSATFHGLNAYQYASYLAKKDPSPQRIYIKLLLRDVLAADLPLDFRVVNPFNLDDFLKLNIKNPHNIVFIVKYRHESYVPLISNDPALLLKTRFNIRFLFFNSFEMFFMNSKKNCKTMKQLIITAIEQGETIANIQEIIEYYLADLKKSDFSADKSFYQCCVELKKFVDSLELNYAKSYLPMIPDAVYEKVLAASSDPKVRAFKEAIDIINYAKNAKEITNEDRYKLSCALGRIGNPIENIDLTDSAGYNPLLYAVKMENQKAVDFIIVTIEVHKNQQKRNQKAVEELKAQLKEIKEQLAKLARSLKDQKAKDEVAKELKDKEKKLDEELNARNRKLQMNERALKSLERKVNGLNAYCLAKHLGNKEILELLAPFFIDECPK